MQLNIDKEPNCVEGFLWTAEEQTAEGDAVYTYYCVHMGVQNVFLICVIDCPIPIGLAVRP